MKGFFFLPPLPLKKINYLIISKLIYLMIFYSLLNIYSFLYKKKSVPI
jgi:hypothetical protein